MAVSDEFTRVAGQFRGELLAHCYRMLGSANEAEDLEADVTALAALLREDIALEMPPMPIWFAGRDTVTRFLAAYALGAPGDLRLVPTAANGQPAFGAYRRGRDGVYHAHALQVLTLSTAGVARVVTFLDPGLFRTFRLPQRFDAAETVLSGR